MDEFSLIDAFFKSNVIPRNDVILGIGDDAACLSIPKGMELLVTCDTLLNNVHFLSSWDAYDIATKAVMVNISDIVAMGGAPCWLLLALTLPNIDEHWLSQFSKGLNDALSQYRIALIGGDTTRGPLSITLTLHGLVPAGRAVRRCGASPGDKIYVSGELGAAALAVDFLTRKGMSKVDQSIVMKKLLSPVPRMDLSPHLLNFATSAIDISDGLAADLKHICTASKVGARLLRENIPIHPLVIKYKQQEALDFAISGGDDYELCFTVAPDQEANFLNTMDREGFRCFPIGFIESHPGLRMNTPSGEVVSLDARGYNHFDSKR